MTKLEVYHNQKLEVTSNHRSFDGALKAMQRVQGGKGWGAEEWLAVILLPTGTVTYQGSRQGWRFLRQTHGLVSL